MDDLEIRCLISGKETDGAIAVFEEPVPPGSGPPMHRHREQHEIFHVMRGTFRFVVDGQTIELGEGGSAFVPMGAAHTFKNIGEEEGLLHFEFVPALNMEEGFERLMTEGSAIGDVAAFFDEYGMDLLGPPLA